MFFITFTFCHDLKMGGTNKGLSYLILYKNGLQNVSFFCLLTLFWELCSDKKSYPKSFQHEPSTQMCQQNETRILNVVLSSVRVSIVGKYANYSKFAHIMPHLHI